MLVPVDLVKTGYRMVLRQKLFAKELKFRFSFCLDYFTQMTDPTKICRFQSSSSFSALEKFATQRQQEQKDRQGEHEHRKQSWQPRLEMIILVRVLFSSRSPKSNRDRTVKKEWSPTQAESISVLGRSNLTCMGQTCLASPGIRATNSPFLLFLLATFLGILYTSTKPEFVVNVTLEGLFPWFPQKERKTWKLVISPGVQEVFLCLERDIEFFWLENKACYGRATRYASSFCKGKSRNVTFLRQPIIDNLTFRNRKQKLETNQTKSFSHSQFEKNSGLLDASNKLTCLHGVPLLCDVPLGSRSFVVWHSRLAGKKLMFSIFQAGGGQHIHSRRGCESCCPFSGGSCSPFSIGSHVRTQSVSALLFVRFGGVAGMPKPADSGPKRKIESPEKKCLCENKFPLHKIHQVAHKISTTCQI